MKKTLWLMTLATVSLLAPEALPCGAGFGYEVEIEPQQQIIVAYDEGVETYIFSPQFCGKATEFGLILPVPATLTEHPTLAGEELFAQLDELTAPNIEEVEICEGSGSCFPMMGSADGSRGGGELVDPGVDVISTGTVGIFDWALLQADSTAAFTDWLDANSFPYPASAQAHFAHYVDKQWHFVAFKFTTADGPPPDGYRLCGDLGPLSLSFATPEPVIPTRIAAVGASGELLWQIFAIADQQQQEQTYWVDSELLFSGEVVAQDLQQYPEIATVAAAGQRITKLNLTFQAQSISDDIYLGPSALSEDFRATKQVYIEGDSCGGCSVSLRHQRLRLPMEGVMLALMALVLGLRSPGRRRR